jgi:autotransporter-associated beta strand protein
MVSDTGSVLHVNDGTLTLATASGKTHSVEYLKGAGGTLELADGASDLITLGFANTNGGDAVGSNSFDYSDATFAGTVLMSGNVAHTVQVGSGTTAGYYEDEQTLSGSLSTSGTDTLVKDGVGRLRLTGDSSSNYDNLITVNHGTLVLGDGSDANADFHSSTSFRVEKGKLEIAANESISNTVQGSATSANNTKSMVGGKGTLSAVTIGSGDNEIDTISPGQGIASSLTSTSSQVQASIGNGAASDSIGTFTVTNLTLNNDAVFDWEITDFDGTAGSDWDVLAYDDLVFGNNAQIDINLFSLLSNGNAGATTGDTFAAKATTSGFKIIDGSGSGSINWGNYGGSGARQVDSLFNINQQGWAHYNHQYGSWGVYYDGGHDFYLTYSAVPEPSTYMMVTGLLMLPGYNFVRRLRKKKLDKLSEEEEGNLS